MRARTIGRLALRGLFLLLVSPALSREMAVADGDTTWFELREATSTTATPPAVADSPARSLTPGETAKLLARLPAAAGETPPRPVTESAGGEAPPAQARGGSEVLQGVSGTPPAPAPPSLRVVRYAPEGAVPVAGALSVTFSEPMVPLASTEDAEQSERLVRITPQPPGRWRWLDTSTLLFEPEGRFPMATSYGVEVPRGVRSLAGSTLDDDVRWSFTTPPPQVITWHPKGGPTSDDPLVFVRFDQRVAPDEVLAKLSARVAGRDWALRLVSRDEADADEVIRGLIEDSLQDRWAVLRPEHKFPAAAPVTLHLASGFRSAEGSLTTAREQTHTFVVRSVLKLVSAETTHPGGWASLQFSNPLDPGDFDPSWISVSPAVERFSAWVQGDRVVLAGVPRRPQKYRVRVTGKLRDVFGQVLGRDVSTALATGKPWVFAGVWLARSPLAVADPKHPSLSVFAQNVASFRLRVYAVEPSSWDRFATLVDEHDPKRGDGDRLRDLATLGPLLLERTVPVSPSGRTPVESRIDLAPCLGGRRHGHLVVSVSADVPEAQRPSPAFARVARLPLWFDTAWVQATGIGIDAAQDGDSLLARATSLVDGRPMAEVEMELAPTIARTRTDTFGLARLPLDERAASMLFARAADDVAFLPVSWMRRPFSPFRWFVADDRGLYRPGEPVRLKGYLRGRDRQGTLVPLEPGAVSRVEYVLEDSRENRLLEGTTAVNRFGSFDLALRLPKVMALGDAQLRLSVRTGAGDEGTHTHALRVEEFRRPEYEVGVRPDHGLVVAGESIVLTSETRYYTGGGLAGAKARWTAEFNEWSSARFTPEGWTEYTFASEESAEGETRTIEGLTNGDGRHALCVATRSVGARVARELRVGVSIEDVSGQSWTGEGRVTILPSQVLVGLKSEQRLVPPTATVDIDVVAVDPKGTPLAGRPITVRVERSEWRQVRGAWEWQALDTQTREVISGPAPIRAAFSPRGAGRHVVSAVVADADGREHASEITLWVTGPEFAGTGHAPDTATVTLDKEWYEPGERARILITSPFFPASGVLTLWRGGLVHSQPVEMSGGSHSLDLSIDEAWIPGGELRVDLRPADMRGSGPAPHHPLSQRVPTAMATAHLAVSRASRRLALRIVAQPAELPPGGETTLSVEVRDNLGRPVVDAEVAVWAVDEAVLAMMPRAFEHPSEALDPDEDAWVSTASLFDNLDLAALDLSRIPPARAYGDILLGSRVAPRAGPSRPWTTLQTAASSHSMVLAGTLPPRRDFSPLAFFVPSVVTDARGRASVSVRVPDSLTRYRLIGLVTDGGLRCGAASDATLTARLPLMARPSPPRFLNRGDEFELPVVVQNDTDTARQTDVAVRTTSLRLVGEAGRSVLVPARGRAELRFSMAAGGAGEATLEVVAAAAELGDSTALELPVRVPVRVEEAAVYGHMDEDGAVRQSVRAPVGALPEVGGVDVTLSSTGLQPLGNAVLSLATYDYECAEQIASRLLAIAALRDVLGAFSLPGLPTADELANRAEQDIQSLGMLQNGDGGFGFWRRGEESWPYVTIHVTHALARAHQKGFRVAPSALSEATSYLEDIENRIPRPYAAEARHALRAYAVYVLHLLGRPAGEEARRLVDEVGLDHLSPEALGWLLPTLAGDVRSSDHVRSVRLRLRSLVTETAGSAHFASAYLQSGHLLLESNSRTDAVLLEALMQVAPQETLIPKLASGLLDVVKQGRWLTTQDASFVLVALGRYFQTYERTTPDFVARLWWGGDPGGSRSFRGRAIDSEHVGLPLARFAPGATLPITISKQGPGRLYYRVGVRHATARIDVPAIDNGMRVARRYLAVDDPRDVQRQPDGRWRFRAGARVRVEIALVAPAERHHVALIDPLPAGLEPLNPMFAPNDGSASRPRTGAAEEDTEGTSIDAYDPWRSGHWFAHHNLRDDRAEAFATSLAAGLYRFEYLARATTKGRFVAPAPKAEEMYAPETYGRGAVDRIVVE